MDKHIKLAVVLAGLSGVILVTAGAFAYSQSTTQPSSDSRYRSVMGNTGTGMMGMGQHGAMNQDCRTRMGGNGIVGCSIGTMRTNETGTPQVAGMACR